MKPEQRPLPADPRFKGATPEQLAQALKKKTTDRKTAPNQGDEAMKSSNIYNPLRIGEEFALSIFAGVFLGKRKNLISNVGLKTLTGKLNSLKCSESSERNNLAFMDSRREHDVLIIGGGPAGSTCARFARKHGLDVAVIGNVVPAFKYRRSFLPVQ